MQTNHIALLQTTLALAEEAFQQGDHPFAAILVVDNNVLMSVKNTVVSEQDPTRHAELSLLSLAAREFGPERLAKATLYTSTEPCPMCAGAIYQCGIPRVVYACSGEGLRNLIGQGAAIPCREIYRQAQRDVEVIGPLLEERGLLLHQRLSWWSPA